MYARIAAWTSLCAVAVSGCQPSADPTPSVERAAGSSRWPGPENGESQLPVPGDNPWIVGWGGAQPESSGAVPGDATPSEVTEEPRGQSPAEDPPQPKPVVPLPDLQRRFSQYWEGDGSEKFLLIEGQLGLSPHPCVVEIYSNGGTSPWRKFELPEQFPLSGHVGLCSADLALPECTEVMGGSVFNGNDALVLRCGDTVMDSFGRVGEDPGKEWQSGGEPSFGSEGERLIRCEESRDDVPDDAFDLGAGWRLYEGSADEPDCAPSGTNGDGGAGGAPAE